MIKTGDYVAYRGGSTKYSAVLISAYGYVRKYTLVSTKSGRRRYQVPENDLTPWGERTPVKAVKTSQGLVKRPRGWKSLMNFSGGARCTWIGEKWVYKKGHNSWGESRCQVEAARYFLQSGGDSEEAIKKFGPKIISEALYYDDVPVAECYLLEDGTLMMERVLPIRSLQRGSGAPSMDAEERERRGFTYGGSGFPAWAGKVDSAQIGVNAKGELVAYDL